MIVQRYKPWNYVDPDPQGEYVEYDDYVKLKEECEIYRELLIMFAEEYPTINRALLKAATQLRREINNGTR